MPANKTYVVGLTGGIGCGKSEAAKYLCSLGAKHIDADAISRSLTADDGAALQELRRIFGDGIFNDDGSLNRRALGDLVFSDVGSKRALEGVIHPLVQRQVMDEIAAASAAGIPVTILDVPLLFETGMDVLCDETWTMSVPPEVQVRRVQARDGMTEEQARARIAGQLPMEERNARSNKVINSDRPVEKTQAELNALYMQLLRRIG
ncbi:MAG: dephospho-CoA kinase [Eubacteriales bacterium]|nr:dephospho-CoA kinase [Eubacteriales bacterium]